MKQLWSLERGPFGHGMVMCEDGLYINLERGGAFRVKGENLRIKEVKQRVQPCQEDTVEENAMSATTEVASGSLNAQTEEDTTCSVESASKNSDTLEKSNAVQNQGTTMNSIWEILVPTITPDGRPIRTRQHREWDSRVRRITGGLTVMQPAKGQWESSDNELFIERMIPVRIACTRKQIDTIADLTAAFYKQQAIMVYRISDEVYIREYKNDNDSNN